MSRPSGLHKPPVYPRQGRSWRATGCLRGTQGAADIAPKDSAARWEAPDRLYRQVLWASFVRADLAARQGTQTGLSPHYLGLTFMPPSTVDSSTRLKLTHWFRWHSIGWYERVYQPYGVCTCGRRGWQYRYRDTLLCTVCYGQAEYALITHLKESKFTRYVPRK